MKAPVKKCVETSVSDVSAGQKLGVWSGFNDYYLNETGTGPSGLQAQYPFEKSAPRFLLWGKQHSFGRSKIHDSGV